MEDVQHSNVGIKRCFHSFCSEEISIATKSKLQTNFLTSSTGSDDNMPHVEESYKLVANAMNKLSLNERQDIYEGIHGVQEEIEETNELINDALHQLEVSISKIEKKSAYMIAINQSKDFVQNYKFRLMFLRATRFNIHEAANKVIRFFEFKLELFGEEKLTKFITFDDLNEEAQNYLKSGRLQVLPCRDRAGRAVIIWFPSTPIVNSVLKEPYECKDSHSMVQGYWYFRMAVIEDDEETQRKGMVIIVGTHESLIGDLSYEIGLLRAASRFSHCAPFRPACIHWLANKTRNSFLPGEFMINAFNRASAVLRCHYGSPTECQYALLSFGIPLHAFQLTSRNGIFKVDNHFKWIRRRKMIDRLKLNGTLHLFHGINLSNKNDILLGKGKPIQNHIGNQYLRDIIEKHYNEYETCCKKKVINKN